MQLRIKRTSRVKPDSAYLRKAARKVTSQRGEDGIIEKIFEIMGTANRYCVEFGAWDGKLYSNTWNLLNNEGWGGLQIEGSAEKFAELQAAYAGNEAVTTLNRLVAPAGPDGLDAVLAEAGAPRDLDLLCIDVDGLDWHIWNGLNDFAPRLVVVEFNPSVPNDILFVQDDDPAVNQGASLLALVELGKSKGYELVATTEWNGFFVPQDLFPQFDIADNHIDAMHDPAHFESRLFQCYDGTLVLAGCKHLLWSNVTIDQADIQVLPKALRKFGDASG
ncbi:MAG: hypothetical protein OXT06_19825 [Rhodospirillaceae bacterium]|nr:hypothetical protein [Rhodospirillaceae bacterium]